jgi:hydrogenase expression/formation protein HypC
MCLGIPMKILKVDEDMAVAEAMGVTRSISLFLLSGEVGVGDYILVHTGFAISKVSPEEAHETLKLIEEMTNLATSDG